MMDLSFLPLKILQPLNLCDLNNLNEIRLRVGFYIKIVLKGQVYYLTTKGLSLLTADCIICEKEDVDFIIKKVTEFSVYAHNSKLKQGYLTAKGGIRIGVAGECVFENNVNLTIKNISSLNIRIPHEIKGCADILFNKIIQDNLNIYNTIIIAPPFYGKTTMLKDIIRKLNNGNFGSILVADERGEFENIYGENIDIIKFSNKNYAFSNGIRALSPKIFVCDELSTNEDWISVEQIINSGVKVIASCHSDKLSNLKGKQNFINVFDRYVFLSNKILGKLEVIFDKNFNEI